MSRPRKLHPPLAGNFASILKAVADGNGVVKSPKVKAEKIKPPLPPKLREKQIEWTGFLGFVGKVYTFLAFMIG